MIAVSRLQGIAWWVLTVASALMMASTLAVGCLTSGCTYAQTGCKAIHVADTACHVLVLEDGTAVPVTREELQGLAQTAAARRAAVHADGGADGGADAAR